MNFDAKEVCRQIWHTHQDNHYFRLMQQRFWDGVFSIVEFTDYIVNHYTTFFRNKTLLENIFSKEFVLTQFGKKRLNVLSLWCSYWQEAYMMAHYLSQINLLYQVYGIDFSPQCIDSAKKWIFEWDPSRKEKSILDYKDFFWDNVYFDQYTQTIQFTNNIKRNLTFEVQNAVKFNPKFRDKFDIIMCYNLLLHLNNEWVQKTLDNIYKYAKSWSVILINTSMHILQKMDNIRQNNYNWILFYQKI